MTDVVKRALDAAFAVGEAQADGVDSLALAGLVAQMNAVEAELRNALRATPKDEARAVTRGRALPYPLDGEDEAAPTVTLAEAALTASLDFDGLRDAIRRASDHTCELGMPKQRLTEKVAGNIAAAVLYFLDHGGSSTPADGTTATTGLRSKDSEEHNNGL